MGPGGTGTPQGLTTSKKQACNEPRSLLPGPPSSTGVRYLCTLVPSAAGVSFETKDRWESHATSSVLMGQDLNDAGSSQHSP